MSQPSLDTTFDASIFDLSPELQWDECEDTMAEDDSSDKTVTDSFSSTTATRVNKGLASIPGSATASVDPESRLPKTNASASNLPASAESATRLPATRRNHRRAKLPASAKSATRLPATRRNYRRDAESDGESDDEPEDILQLVNDKQLSVLLPSFLDLVTNLSTTPQPPSSTSGTASTPPTASHLKIIDLSHDPGNAIRKVLTTPIKPQPPLFKIFALATSWIGIDDAKNYHPDDRSIHLHDHSVTFVLYNPRRALETIGDDVLSADAVIASLVIGNVPLREVFALASQLLRPGGHVLLTGVHADVAAPLTRATLERDVQAQERIEMALGWVDYVPDYVPDVESVLLEGTTRL